jgi:hypothetical protein
MSELKVNHNDLVISCHVILSKLREIVSRDLAFTAARVFFQQCAMPTPWQLYTQKNILNQEVLGFLWTVNRSQKSIIL